MKKLAIALSLGVLLSTSLIADFLKVEIGTGAWVNSSSGQISYAAGSASGIDNSKESENTNPYIWAYLKQPIPLVPNIRLEYIESSSDGVANGTFEDFIAASAPTQLDITQYDVIPYYNLLDNTAWITLDVGLDIKVMEITYSAQNVNVIANPLETNYSESETIALPLLYVRSRVEIQATNIGLEADMKFVTYNSSKVYDIRAKIDYTFDMFPAIEPAVEVGYRTQKFDIDDSDIDGVIDLDFSGFYAGLMIRF